MSLLEKSPLTKLEKFLYRFGLLAIAAWEIVKQVIDKW